MVFFHFRNGPETILQDKPALDVPRPPKSSNYQYWSLLTITILWVLYLNTLSQKMSLPREPLPEIHAF